MLLIIDYLSEFIVANSLVISILGRCWVFFPFFQQEICFPALVSLHFSFTLFDLQYCFRYIVHRLVAVYINILGAGNFSVLLPQVIFTLYPLMSWFVFLIINSKICQTEEFRLCLILQQMNLTSSCICFCLINIFSCSCFRTL